MATQVTLNSGSVDSAGSLALKTNGTTTAVTIDTSQNVGIGTASPQRTLHVENSSGNLVRLNNSSSANGSYSSIELTSTGGNNCQIRGVQDSSTAGHLEFYTLSASAVSERMRIDSSGNVGIGTSSPTAKLDILGGIRLNKNGDLSTAKVGNFGSTNFEGYIEPYSSSGWTDIHNTVSTTGVRFFTGNSDAERMRIDSSGNLLVGTTSTGQGTRIVVKGAGSVNWSVGPDNSTGNVFYVLNTGGTGVGLTTGNTSWSAVSDERIKDIIEPITDAINKVSTLRAVIGKYKTDEEGTRRSFLIAQDVQAVLPEVIDTHTDEQGTMSIRYTEVIPLLVASIKEQQAIITQLQADVAALKGTA